MPRVRRREGLSSRLYTSISKVNVINCLQFDGEMDTVSCMHSAGCSRKSTETVGLARLYSLRFSLAATPSECGRSRAP